MHNNLLQSSIMSLTRCMIIETIFENLQKHGHGRDNFRVFRRKTEYGMNFLLFLESIDKQTWCIRQVILPADLIRQWLTSHSRPGLLWTVTCNFLFIKNLISLAISFISTTARHSGRRAEVTSPMTSMAAASVADGGV